MENSNTNNQRSYVAHEDDLLVELMDLLEEIDESKASAIANETSMADAEGRRIYF